MPELDSAVEKINKYVILGKELLKIAAFLTPQYRESAKDLYAISKKIFDANEALLRWVHSFRDFNFKSPNVHSEFTNLKKEYRAMKVGGIQDLKYHCYDIGNIYSQNIEKKLIKWFTNDAKIKEAEKIFIQLGEADNSLISFIVEEVLNKVDDFIKDVDDLVDSSDFDSAYVKKLEFRVKTKDIEVKIEQIVNDLSDLVIQFAHLAHIPITI